MVRTETTLTPEAKKLLAETIRGTAHAPDGGLRARLVGAVHDEAERRYRLSLPLAEAGLDEAHRARRERLEAWLDQRARSATNARGATREQALAQAEKEAAATFLTRLLLLRQLEALGLSRPALITGGWNSEGDRALRELTPTLLEDESEGYPTLLQRVFDELATTMPALFGDADLTRLLPVPAATLREVVEALQDPALASAWSDDTTLGWAYQFWNDPERREIDARLDAQCKLEAADVAAKTQVFTERYMVEWLLHNSLGFTWRSMCKKHGWTAEVGRDRYFVTRPVPEEAAACAPASVRDIKLLDPACGTGHFLVIAFELLAPLYREEARHLGTTVTEREIAESILENNLHGIDIDPGAVQLAAASLYLKARVLCGDARPRRINLVAPSLQLGELAAGDPALALLREDLEREAGIPEELTTRLLARLAGADHLGSLLKVDVAVEQALADVPLRDARTTVTARLAQFLAAHASSKDLGLYLDGEQPAKGLRFLELTRPGAYDIVAGNPPYFGTQALADTRYLDEVYPLSKENLCTAMLERATELAREGGQVAFVTVRNWLYVSQLAAFRRHLFQSFPPSCAADLGLGGFESLPGVESLMFVARRGAGGECLVVDAREGGPSDKASVLAGSATLHATDPAQLARLPGSPFVYRWDAAAIEEYLSRPLLGDVAPVRVGMKTSDNLRFVRCPWELAPGDVQRAVEQGEAADWVPYVKGAAGKVWIEPLSDLLDWRDRGLAVRIALEAAYRQGPQGERHFFTRGVAFSTIGRSFLARAHRYPSIFDVAGSSAFPPDVAATVCLLNSRFAREVVQDLNPTINFQVGDVARIPYRPDARAAEIFRVLEEAFAEHEARDELSPGFRRPQPSPWPEAQRWAQRAVDSSETAGLPPPPRAREDAPPFAFISFAVGVAMGRFGARGEGWLESAPETALPSGVLFVSASGGHDSLDHAACAPLREAWNEHCAALGQGSDLRAHLRRAFFDEHKKLYENRPIYLPLSSAKRSFVALVSIHRWQDDTLHVLLADHLVPARCRLEGELGELRKGRIAERNDGKTEKRFTEVQRLLQELNDFIASVIETAERGPPRPDRTTPEREADARHAMHLADGVRVNSAALWPLLEPSWKEPRTWWSQLAARRGPKGAHFDWSATAARYFPARVNGACEEDVVLASAHRCLWRYHPRTAYAWELKLQARAGRRFAITEPDADPCRARFLEAEPRLARALEATETKRRARRPSAPATHAGAGGAEP